MNLIAHYLHDFNRDYLSTPRDRRRTAGTILAFAATVALVLVIGFCLL